jgi:hypothetical protein
MLEMGEVSLFACAPERLWLRVGVGASTHDTGNAWAKLFQNHRLPFWAAVLNGVV